MENSLRLTIQTYNKIARDYVKATRDFRPQADFESFCRSVTPGGIVLDAGCGWGRDCKAFAGHGFSVVGIDLSAEMLKIARHFAPGCTFIQADLRDIPIDDCCINGIWCCASLLHLERSQVPRALTEFKRVLKKGATCCILVKKGVGEGIDRGERSGGRPRFFTYFLEEELRVHANSHGFEILNEHTTTEQKSRRRAGQRREWIYLLIRKN